MKNRIIYARCACCVLLMLVCASVHGEEFTSWAPFATEEAAVAAGERLGIGQATIEGPHEVEALTFQSWTLTYTAGRAGIKPGGGIRIALRHMAQWSPPQTEDPTGLGYSTFSASNGAPLTPYIEFNQFVKARFFTAYHPWQNIVELVVGAPGLAPGDTIRVVLGDTSGGSRGMRIQPFDETHFVFKFYVDALGNDQYVPLAKQPWIQVVAAAPYRLGIVMPSDAVVGEPTWCIVRAEDEYGNPATTYRGTVQLTTTIDGTELPKAYTFTAADNGVHRFEGIRFGSPAEGLLVVEDAEHGWKREGNPIRVHASKPALDLCWGDLHGHTLYSDGRGTVEEFYAFARDVAGLDFCAVTDHAFLVSDAMWKHSKNVTNAMYQPGRFVTFQAYEWSGQEAVGGDHNVFFLDDDPPIIRTRTMYDYRNLQMYHGPDAGANHVEDLYTLLAPCFHDENIFVIPHWGGRHGNPNWHNAKLQRMIEVFSEHRRSEDWMTTFLTKGYRLGIMAATDGHYGNPGYGYLRPSYDWTKQEIGMAAVAVYTPARTREAIFRSLYDRHVYATSGDRIILDVQADGHVMGTAYDGSASPTISIHVVGTDTINQVEIKKNSEVVQTIPVGSRNADLSWTDESFGPDDHAYYYVRVVQANNEEAISSPIWVD